MSDMPHSPEHEAGALGCMLLSPDEVIPEALIKHGIDADMFYVDTNQKVAHCLFKMFNAHLDIDIITVPAKLHESYGMAKVDAHLLVQKLMDDVAVAAHSGTYLSVVLDRFMRREAMIASENTVKEALSGDFAGVDVLKRGSQDLADRVSTQVLSANNEELCSDIAADIKKIERGEVEVLGQETGFRNLDFLLNGLGPGLNVVGARPSIGKTAFEGTIMRYLCEQGIPVARCCFDMTAKQLLIRMAASVSKVSLPAMIQGHAKKKNYAAFYEALELVQSWPMYILDQNASRDVSNVCAWWRAMAARHHIKLFSLDFIQLVEIKTSKHCNRNEEIQRISAMLKKTSHTLGIPALILSQLSRLKGQTPGLEDLRDSGAIEQDASTVQFLYNNPDFEEHSTKTRRCMTVEVAKNQQGECGKIAMFQDANVFNFRETDPDYGVIETVDAKGRTEVFKA